MHYDHQWSILRPSRFSPPAILHLERCAVHIHFIQSLMQTYNYEFFLYRFTTRFDHNGHHQASCLSKLSHCNLYSYRMLFSHMRNCVIWLMCSALRFWSILFTFDSIWLLNIYNYITFIKFSNYYRIFLRHYYGRRPLVAIKSVHFHVTGPFSVSVWFLSLCVFCSSVCSSLLRVGFF